MGVKWLGLPPSVGLLLPWSENLWRVSLKPAASMRLLDFALASTALLCCGIKASEDSRSCLWCESANIERQIRFRGSQVTNEFESGPYRWATLWPGLVGLQLNQHEEWKTLPQLGRTRTLYIWRLGQGWAVKWIYSWFTYTSSLLIGDMWKWRLLKKTLLHSVF